MSGTVIVVNPAAGGGRAARTWERLAGAAAALAEHRVVSPDGPQATREAVAAAVAGGCDRVVCVGGDGTVHLVAGVLLAAGAGERVTIGVVPVGTGSDLARTLAVVREPRAALERALLGPPVAMDAARCTGEAGDFTFVNTAAAGIAGLVDELVNAQPQRGSTVFLRATLAALRRYRCVPVRLRADGEEWVEGPALLVAVANGTTFGKGMRIAPGARLDDGLLDVVFVGEVRPAELPMRLTQLYLGKHMGAEPVRHRRVRRLDFEPLGQLPVFDADGEPYPSGKATFEVLPGALRVAGPLAPSR
jgi:diacylglycerol kinase (ATP)